MFATGNTAATEPIVPGNVSRKPSEREFATPYLSVSVEEVFPVIFERKTVATLLVVLEVNRIVP